MGAEVVGNVDIDVEDMKRVGGTPVIQTSSSRTQTHDGEEQVGLEEAAAPAMTIGIAVTVIEALVIIASQGSS